MNNWNTYTILESEYLSPRVKLLTIQGEQREIIPGQYVSVKVSHNGVFSAEREYSAIETAKPSIFQLAVNLIDTGELSPKLHNLKSGDDIHISGPKGNHFLLNGIEDNFVCIAGGAGISPFVGLIRNNKKNFAPKNITLLASFKSLSDYLFQEELKEVYTHTNIMVTLTQHAPLDWTDRKGRINQEMIASATEKLIGSTRFYICGGSLFVESMREILTKMNIPQDMINYERFG